MFGLGEGRRAPLPFWNEKRERERESQSFRITTFLLVVDSRNVNVEVYKSLEFFAV